MSIQSVTNSIQIRTTFLEYSDLHSIGKNEVLNESVQHMHPRDELIRILKSLEPETPRFRKIQGALLSSGTLFFIDEEHNKKYSLLNPEEKLLGGNDHKNERACGTQELMAEARRITEGNYNILVIKAGHDYDITKLNINKTEEREVGGTRYKIYAIVDGTVINRGDGGYINWCFWGKFDRDGGKVTFHRL